MDAVCDRIRQDYANFPKAQSYDLYAADVYFQDPLNRFRGVERYRDMIGFIDRWFQNPKLELHSLEQVAADHLQTQWTLSWIAPFPWQPSMAISGWTDYRLDEASKVISHIDHWHCSRWSVVGQALGMKGDR
ncbi:MAG: DUF2358 domain-containing protein [Cyanobacteria bacterium P01_H01_bin.58]